MAEPHADSADEWAAMACDELRAAQKMVNLQDWKRAYYHAGYAVEFVLKGRIMRHERLNQWPTSGRRELYSHNLASLVRLAGLEAEIQELVGRGASEGLAWLVVKDWTPMVRYNPQAFPEIRAREMLACLVEGGLMEWLMRRSS